MDTETSQTYFIGAHILDDQALVRAQEYANQIRGYSDGILEIRPLVAIPFFDGNRPYIEGLGEYYEQESKRQDHIIHETIFCIRGLDLLEHKDETLVVCPIAAYNAKPGAWEEFSAGEMKRLFTHGIEFTAPIPDKPFIIIASGKDFKRKRALLDLVEKSRMRGQLPFQASEFSVFVKEKASWNPLPVQKVRS